LEIALDIEQMTLADLEFFEEQSGLSIEDLSQGRFTTKAILALITIDRRRTDPAYTMDDARKLKFGEVEFAAAADPTAGEAAGS